MQTFGEKLRKLRQNKGVSLKELAKYLEVHHSFIGRVELNEKKATRKQIKQLADYFKVDEEELMVEFLSDNLVREVENEPYGYIALELAMKKLKHKKGNK